MPKRVKVSEKRFILPYAGTKLNEKFKSEVASKAIKFPRELGEEHPFNFKEAELAYSKIGLAKAAVDKHLDFIISPGFYVEGPKQAANYINDFIKNTDFENVIKKWIKEALMKGNGFIEKDLPNKKIKLINANTMYVKRDESGEVIKYNQFVDNLSNFKVNKVIPFEVDEIAHLTLDQVGDCAYGLGLLYPAFLILDNLAKSEKDSHMLMNRKANNPIIVKLGTPEEPATQTDIDNMGSRLEYLNNMHEWVFDHKVDFSVVDFGNLSEKFEFILKHDTDLLFYTFQVPPVIMGSDETSSLGQAGKSGTQMDAFERRIQSIQAEVERVIETQIFKPLLEKKGLKGEVEIHWGLQSETRTNERLVRLTEIIKVFGLSPQLKIGIERDMANLLGYEDVVSAMPKPADVEEETPEAPEQMDPETKDKNEKI